MSNHIDLKKQIERLAKTLSAMDGEKPKILFGDFAAGVLVAQMNRPTLKASTKALVKNQILNHLIPGFGEMSIENITNETWNIWVNKMRGQKRTMKKSLSLFFNSRKVMIFVLLVAKEMGHIEKLPKLDNPDEKRSSGRAIPDEEVLRLLWKARSPFRFIFYVFWRTGCRPREILQWRWDMLKWNQIEFTWIDIPGSITKTGRSRSIPLDSTVSKILKIRKARGNGSEFIFPNNNKISPLLRYDWDFRLAARRAKLKNIRPYDFRRTFITNCAVDGKPTIFVAKYCDTSVKLIEEVYAKVNTKAMENVIK